MTTSGSALLEISGNGFTTRSTPGTTGPWAKAMAPSGIRRGKTSWLVLGLHGDKGLASLGSLLGAPAFSGAV